MDRSIGSGDRLPRFMRLRGREPSEGLSTAERGLWACGRRAVGEGFAVEWPGVAGVTEDDVEGLEGIENMPDLVGDTVNGDGWENWERAGKSCGTLKVTAY